LELAFGLGFRARARSRVKANLILTSD